jgi:Protein of unknown function (DUF1236)
MRNSLLATIAAAALVAGTIAVSGQGMQGGGGGAGAGGGAGGAPSAQGGGGGAGGAPSTAPAEKMDRGSPKGTTGQGSPKGTTGQGTGSQMDRGQSSQPGAAQERGQTGQPQMRDQPQPRTGQGQTPQQQRGQTGQQQKGQPGTQQQTGQGQSGAGSAALTTEQRSRIRTTVLQGGNVNRVSNVNFNIRVGTVVPRSVKLVAVPPAILEVHPAWRGFLYFVVNDEIVIVEPGTLRIVAVIA